MSQRQLFTLCGRYGRDLPDFSLENADPDIPILKEAKAEYAKLK